MSSRQREHSKLYCGYKGAAKKLDELAEEEVRRGNTEDIDVVLLPGLPDLSPETKSSKDIVGDLSCGADAIVIGTVQGKVSQLTDCGTFTFTDYELAIDEVLKDNSKSHLDVNANITVTRPGGRILLNGHVINAIDRSVKPLKIGSRYLLFLHFLPNTDAYQATDIDSAFQVNASELVAQTDSVMLPAELKKTSASSFIQDVRNAGCRCKTQER